MRHMLVAAAAAGMLALAGCDDPKPGRGVSNPSPQPSSAGSSSPQGVAARQTPGDSMPAPGGNGEQQQRLGPNGEPAAGTQPGATAPKPTNPVPGHN